MKGPLPTVVGPLFFIRNMTPPDRDLNRAGVEAAMRGDLGAAERAFRTALQNTPNNPGVFLNLTRLADAETRP